MDVIELSRQGETYEFSFGDLNTSAIASAFKLDPGSVFLKKEVGRRLYFPDDDGKFNIAPEPGIAGPYGLGLMVEGSPPAAVSKVQESSAGSSSGDSPCFKPFTVGKKGAVELATFNVKVVKSVLIKCGNKVDFDKHEQIHISVTERTANVHTITSAVQKKWGPNYYVVGSDGLEIDDSSGTQGKFWRSPSRRYYAIKRPMDTATDSDDDDFDMPGPSRPKRKREERALVTVKSDVQHIREDLQRLYQIDRHTRVQPVGLHRQLQETFKCKICHGLIKPGVIFARCCKTIIGCQTCTDQWYEGDGGMTKTCPFCGTDRALPDTIRLHGLDDFLSAIEPLMEGAEQEP